MVGSNRNPKDDTYNSSVTATIEGLNILDMVTADRIVARVTSKQRLDEEEPTILSIGSRIENLRIAGCPIQVDLDNELFAAWARLRRSRRNTRKTSSPAK